MIALRAPALSPAVFRAAALVAAVLACGCVGKGGSKLDVKRIDANTFEITAHALVSLSGAASLREQNEQVATAYCAEKNKPMTVVDRHGYAGIAPQDILTFRCGAAPLAKPARPGKAA